MFRLAVLISALSAVPAVASAQQPCTTDARRVVDEIYRHMLERGTDRGSDEWVNRLMSGATVRDVVREIAKSPEHLQRWGNESHDKVVRTFYRHILNHDPDANSQRETMEIAARRGLPAAVDQIVNSRDYRQAYGDWGVPGSNGLTYCASGNSGQYGNSPVSGMRFRGMDTNNDGKITRDEWRGNERSFQNFDLNNDGVLSGDEISINARRGNRGEDVMDNAERFDYLDVNGNGVIDRNEWDGARQAFDSLDTNRDGRLTRAEYGETGRAANDFNALDANHDGRIALNEWPWTHRSFDEQDSNRDGFIERNEFRGNTATRRN